MWYIKHISLLKLPVSTTMHVIIVVWLCMEANLQCGKAVLNESLQSVILCLLQHLLQLPLALRKWHCAISEKVQHQGEMASTSVQHHPTWRQKGCTELKLKVNNCSKCSKVTEEKLQKLRAILIQEPHTYTSATAKQSCSSKRLTQEQTETRPRQMKVIHQTIVNILFIKCSALYECVHKSLVIYIVL